MISWETYQRAALEYSRLAPRRIIYTLTPVVGERGQALPEDALAPFYVDWGDGEGTITDAILGGGSDSGWAWEAPTLYLVPAPTDETPITVFYYGRHLPDELTQSYPTVPVAHLPHIDDLEAAIVLESENAAQLLGPLNYQVGQTKVDRSSGPLELRMLASLIRQRIDQKLTEPASQWA